jgi:hypothetical protein
MEAMRVLVEVNEVEVPTATPWAAGCWFSFTYYVPPALLAGREARRL